MIKSIIFESEMDFNGVGPPLPPHTHTCMDKVHALAFLTPFLTNIYIAMLCYFINNMF